MKPQCCIQVLSGWSLIESCRTLLTPTTCSHWTVLAVNHTVSTPQCMVYLRELQTRDCDHELPVGLSRVKAYKMYFILIVLLCFWRQQLSVLTLSRWSRVSSESITSDTLTRVPTWSVFHRLTQLVIIRVRVGGVPIKSTWLSHGWLWKAAMLH